MNKTEQDYVWKVVERSKKCLLGKIEQDIRSRLPGKPDPLDGWDKYKLIKQGSAKLKLNLKISDLVSKYSDGGIRLIDAFNYPERNEEILYKKALKAIQSEKDTREMAVEGAFNRLADERILELIDGKEFLDQVEKLSSGNW